MFNSNGSGASLSDIAALLNNNGEFGGNGGWWVLIILLALFGGFGGYGYGGLFGGGSGAGANVNYVLASDFANLERKIDGVNNGLCDGFYAMNTGMLNGFSGVNNSITAGVNTLVAGQTSLGYAMNQGFTGVQSSIGDLKYQMATDTCAIKSAVNEAAQNIMLNDNANYRALHDEIVQGKLEAKDAQIADLTARVNALMLASSQEAQTNTIINRVVDTLQPCPKPSYIVPSPYSYYGGCINSGCCAA